MVEGVAVEIDQVSKRFGVARGHPGLLALDGIGLTIRPGEFVSLLGASGCGKSTLLKLVAGLQSPTEGTVRVGSKPVDGPYTSAGVVFQSDLLLEWRTALDNVLLQAEMRGEPKSRYVARAVELLELVGLGGFGGHYPRELSGGMRQRVAICRALLLDFPLVLMDEPFGALDAITRDQLNVDLEHVLRHRPTVLFVTHSLDEAIFLSDRVLVMTPRPGRVDALIDIDLPRPRRLAIKDDPRFDQYASEIRTIFQRQGVLSESDDVPPKQASA
jgi:NitT/TauT family transport system ATP-binding protein